MTRARPMGWVRGLRDGEHGASLVEFTLALTMLLLLAMGTIEFGRVIHAQIILDNGAREGARVAATGASNGEIQTAVLNAVADLDTGLVSVNSGRSTGANGVTATVTVEYPVTIVVPLITPFFPENPVVLDSTASMRLE